MSTQVINLTVDLVNGSVIAIPAGEIYEGERFLAIYHDRVIKLPWASILFYAFNYAPSD